MKMWQEIPISELGDVYTGRTPPSKNPKFFGDEYPFITPSDMDGRKFISTTERYLSRAGAELLNRIVVPANSVCVSCIGWQMGKAAMTTRPSVTNQQINTIVTNDKILSNFLYYSLLPRKEELLSLGAATGVRTPILNKSAFSSLKVKVPSKENQFKITNILSAYDDLIENNTRRIAILEEMAQALYREWFVHFRFPGHEQQVPGTSEVPGTLGNGRLPKGWELVTLGDIAEEVRRSVDPVDIDPQTPYIGLAHMPKKSIALSEWGKASEANSTKLQFKRGEILFGKIRPYFHKVGVAAIDGVCSTDTIIIVPKLPEWFSITLCCVSSIEFVDHATQTSKGTKMPRADWNILMNYPIAIPPQDLLHQYSQFIKNTIKLIHNLIFRNANLRQTRDLLLPRLISGELDVSHLPLPTTHEELVP